MLPLSHTYISINVVGRKDPFLLVGSVIPDITTTSKGVIKRDLIHNSPFDFYNFVKENYPKALDLGLGLLLHCEQSKGADYYSDDFEIGYAYLNGKILDAEVKRMFGVDDSEDQHVFSHNLIEIALDLLIGKEFPNTADAYVDAQNSLDKKLLVEILSSYLKQNADVIEKEIDNFMSTLSKDNLLDKDKMIEEVTLPLVKMRMDSDIRKEDVMRLIDRALEIIQDTHKDFLNTVVKEMKSTFTPFLH